jgi:DNA-binding GntR family transcriptional regulator
MLVMKSELAKARVDRKRPLRDQIYELIRNLVLTGKIGPGEIVDEKLIAAQLKVSRTPVREAVKKLSDEHLIDVIAQSGTRAALIDRHEVEQAYIIRRALEMESAAQAAKLMTPAHADSLADILMAHARALERKDYILAIAVDDRFHRTISEISNLPRLWRAVEISKAQLDRCRHMMLLHAGEGEATLEEHREIIRGLNSGDPEKARAAMAYHLERAFGNAAKVLDAEALITPHKLTRT